MLSGAIVIVIYLSLLYTSYKGYTNAFVGIVILTCCFYDYLFIEMAYEFPEIIPAILKPYQEYIILASCIVILLTKRRYLSIRVSFKERIIFIYAIPILIFSTVVAFVKELNLSIFIYGLRCFFIPIFFAYVITYKGGITIKPWIFNCITVTIVGFAIYQYISFAGDLSDLWVYNHNFDEYGENSMDRSYYNYIKDDSLRAISVFVTPIDFSTTSAICAVYYICLYCFKRNYVYLIMTSISVIGIILSQTRIGIFVLVIGIFVIFYLKFNKVAKKRFLIIVPLIMIVITLISIMVIGDLDLSALGRLKQYIDFGDKFTIFGTGLGDQSGVFDFDSFILCCLNLFGIIGIFYLSIYVIIFSKAIETYNMGFKNNLSVFTISLGTMMLYISGFHHIAGSFAYWLTIILLFNQISFNQSNVKPIIQL